MVRGTGLGVALRIKRNIFTQMYIYFDDAYPQDGGNTIKNHFPGPSHVRLIIPCQVVPLWYRELSLLVLSSLKYILIIKYALYQHFAHCRCRALSRSPGQSQRPKFRLFCLSLTWRDIANVLWHQLPTLAMTTQ